ncbi:cadmium/zinc-transporting ATPase HMA2-like [Stylophora pistillata]|uniref:P-type Cu(+) transporter n=1 Tax=Stylophora pistillata TaxID=50429 RepID=A0A2B4S6E1_STYPI|nr:cadmium/zinc-transporting ATPase HMA2-like [Stylophora pistillata]XP_022789655.1 cadmium/zinc-transporting ATPase HMA2-like [Stylophora pistillata]XP_022789656.1 cadmium/zinc-transporting ATPase HMA2-like [Stylophora pistillata]PFX26244.1 Cadmium/zinc-transporting ATPase HMA2 [Stylophora pistillata]
MCQEFHCNCCSDELPEDSCECGDCYHGDQNLDDAFPFLKDGEIATKCNSEAKWRSSLNSIDLYPSKTCGNEEKMSKPCCASASGLTESCCEDGKDLYGEEVARNPCTSSCSKQPRSCSDDEMDSCNEESQCSPWPSASATKQLSDEAADSCRSKCCSDTINEGRRDEPVKGSCCSQVKSPQEKEDTSSEKTSGQLAQTNTTTEREIPQRNSTESGGPSRNPSLDCCGRTVEDDCGDSCQTSGNCTDKDSGRPSSSAGASSVLTRCETGGPCRTSRGQVTCQLRNPRLTITCSPVEDNCCQSQACNGFTLKPRGDDCCQKSQLKLSVEQLCDGNRSVNRISMTDRSGFYPITPPLSPGIQELDDSSKKKPVIRQSTTKLRVQNICCAMESALVQESLEPLEGVKSIAVNVIGRVVYVRHDPEVTSATELVSTLNRMHLGASIMETGSRQYDEDNKSLPPSLSTFLIYLLFQTVLLMTGVVAFFCDASWYKWPAIAEIVFGIFPVLKKTYVSIKTCSVDINILMLIAIGGTLGIEEWLEGAAVVYVFSFAEALQNFCMYKVQRTISGLMLKAPQAAILANTGESVSVESVAIGTAIAIRPGELIPLDGEVVKGRAAVDESSVSGESVPVEKTVGSKVFSGTVNQNGYLEVKTTSDASSSTVSRVAQLVQEAQTSSARTEVAINRFAKYYTPTLVVVATLVFVIPAILGAAGVGTYSQELKKWGVRALVLLVTACPCALVMSTPIAVICSITAAARKGALIKGGVHLETLAQLQVLAFDKTGTLTEGKFQVVDIDCVFGVRERAALRLAAALESKSSHPLAAAIVKEFSGCVAEMVKSRSSSLPEVTRFKLHEGQGVSGYVDGQFVQIGNYEFLNNVGNKALYKCMEEKYITWCNESKTVIFVAVDGKLAMMIALADTIRPNSLSALDWLRKARVQTAMITGDNSRTAMAVKSKLGLVECIADMKPQDKLLWIKERQGGTQSEECEMHGEDQQARECVLPCAFCCPRRRYNVVKSGNSDKNIVGMVGDGVNDGPALAAANIGIAMGAGGTALAVEAADVALMSNNLAKIPELVLLGRFCSRVVAENISFSIILKLAIVITALAGKAALWMAVLADVLGLLFVIVNGLRPLRWNVVKNEIAFPAIARPSYYYESYV